MPSDETKIEFMGEANLPYNKDCKPIKQIKIPTNLAFDLYINHKQLDLVDKIINICEE